MNIKTFFNSIKKNKRDIYFGLAGFILAVILIFVFVDGVSYFVSNVQRAFEEPQSSYLPVNFNIAGLKSLGIYSEESTSNPEVQKMPADLQISTSSPSSSLKVEKTN